MVQMVHEMKRVLSVLSIFLIVAGLVIGTVYALQLLRNAARTKQVQEIHYSNTDTLITNESSQAPVSDNTNVQTKSSTTIQIRRNPMSDLLEINPDTTGWIQIEDTRIDYPVVKGRDNEYYLNHDFHREQSITGAIFMDYRNVGDGSDPHTIVYGHGIRDKSMFHDLVRFLDPTFYESHRDIEMKTLYETVQYRVFAAYRTNTDVYFIRTKFDDGSYREFVDGVRARTAHAWDTEVVRSDRLLTLVTCSPDLADGRLVVHAVRIDGQ